MSRMTLSDRIAIEAGIYARKTLTEIAKSIYKSRRHVSEEIRRNGTQVSGEHPYRKICHNATGCKSESGEVHELMVVEQLHYFIRFFANGDATDPLAVDFLNFCMSTEGQAIATEEGYIGGEGEAFESTMPSGSITVGGSSSVSPLMEKLIEAYKAVNANASIELLTTDSTVGVSGALDGTYTIGMASRELKDSDSNV